MSRVCLFMMWSPDGELLNFRKTYIRELARHMPTVVLAAGSLTDNSKSYLREHGIEHAVYPNQGLDFGVWYRALRDIGDEIHKCDSVHLANDSCVLIRRLDDYFRWTAKSNVDYFGVSSAGTDPPHIQSFCFGWKKAITPMILNYFNAHGIRTRRNDVIYTYEVGLSTCLREKKVRMWAQYPYTMGNPTNMPEICTPFLLNRGFPLVKRRVLPCFAQFLHQWSEFDANYLLEGICDPHLPGFDEDFYLEKYPDVQKLISDRLFTCGYEHFRRVGENEGRMPNRENWPVVYI